jgi:hypothetical protein
MTDEYCPMCDEYAISDGYVVLKTVDLARDYIPKSVIRAKIKELEEVKTIRLKNGWDYPEGEFALFELKDLLKE